MKPQIDLPPLIRRLPMRRRLPGAHEAVLLELDTARGLAEAPPSSPIDALRSLHTPMLRTLVDHLRRAATDPDVVGLIATIGTTAPTLAQTGELRSAIAAFRAAGKPTIAWAPSFGEFGIGTTPYHLAAAFEEIWLQPSGSLGLIGFSAQALHLRGALDKLGIEPQFGQRHEFKSAADLFLRDSMSEPVREMLTSLVASATDTLVADIARDRSLTEPAVREAIDAAPLSADRAHQLGLVDQLGYRDEAFAAIRARVGGIEPSLRFVERHGVGRLDGLVSRIRSLPTGKPVVAVVQASGVIHLGQGGSPGQSGRSVSADRLGAVLQAAARDDTVRAVVLRIDSPGGSYVASDAIRRDILSLRETGTPVVASMASVAASGGYYIAMPCQKIVAGAGTITGSIGVLAGKQVLRETLRRIGITTETVPGSRHADMFSTAVAFDDEELTRLETWLDDIYADFTTKAALDRGMDVEALRRVARGRVWTGADAARHGLVDRLGGLDDAVQEACSLAELDREDCDVRAFPKPHPLEAILPPKNSESASAATPMTAEGPALWARLLAASGLASVMPWGELVSPGVLSLLPVRLTGLLPDH